MSRQHIRIFAAVASAVAVMTALGGCASTPVPNEKIAVAQASLQRAEQNGAPEYAPVELATARDKLARAQAAAAHNDEVPATQLAEQADIDAQLAEATAAEKQSAKAAAQFDASLQALRQSTMQNANPN